MAGQERGFQRLPPVTRRVAPLRDSAPLGFPPPALRWLPPSISFPRVTNCNTPCTSERGWQPLESHLGHLTWLYLIWGPAPQWETAHSLLSVCLSEVYAPAHTLGGGQSGSVSSLSHRRCQEAGLLFRGPGRVGALFLENPVAAPRNS